MRNKYFKFTVLFAMLVALLIAVAPQALAQVQIPQVGGQTGTILGSGNLTVRGLILRVISIALEIAGFVAILFIIYGGYLYLTAGGNEDQAESGKHVLTNAIIGFAIIILSFVILTVVQNTIITGV